MKKSYLLGMFALAALTMVGCSNDEVVNDYSPENAIQFGTYVGRDAEARVAETDLETLKDPNWGFGVYAHYKINNGTAGITPNFMNNQQVTWNSTNSAWEYFPVKYWPNNDGDEITFWAYAPWNTKNTYKVATAPCFAVADGTDYVAAAPVTKNKKSVNDVDDLVTFTFEHMMSKVGFKVEAIIDELEHAPEQDDDNTNGDEDEETDGTNNSFAADETNIVVTGVSLQGNLDVAGTYTWNGSAWYLTTTDGTESKTHTLDATKFQTTGYYCFDDTEDAKQYVNGQLATIDKTELNNASSYLMLIPQSVGINITVKYSVITRDENLATGYSKVDNMVSSGDFDFIFEGGKAYNFVLHLGLTSVKLSATVNDWEDSEDYVVNVPLNIENDDVTTP